MAKSIKELIASAKRSIHYKKRLESKINELSVMLNKMQDEILSLQDTLEVQKQVMQQHYLETSARYQESLLSHLGNVENRLRETQNHTLDTLLQHNQYTHFRLDTLLINTLRPYPISRKCKKHILFIVHNMTTWTALSGVYQAFRQRDDVAVFVLAIQAESQDNNLQNAYSAHTQIYLQQENIAHHVLNPHDIEAYLAYMASINPDYVIRQAPWDADIPALCSSLNLAKYKTVYIPYYSLDLLENFEINGLDLEINQNFHLYCHKIYCSSRLAYDKAQQAFIGNPDSLRFLGNTKLEYIDKKFSSQTASQPGYRQTLNILWAPHHSINSEWLAFGTFEKNCLFFIDLAQRLGSKIHIKYRPHPILSVSMNNRFPDMYREFMEKLDVLDNISVDDGWNYIDSFEWSDMLVTDGVSFIAEYPLTNKPIVFIENPHHMKFNSNGELARLCCHIATDNADIENYICQALNGRLHIHTQAIEQYRKVLSLDRVAENIVADILQD